MGKLGAGLSTFLIVLIFCVELSTCKLTVEYSWKEIDFQFPNDSVRQELIKSRGFSQSNLLMDDAAVWQNKLFLNLPRYFSGVPATLTYINLNDPSGDKSPKLIPYPDWETNQVNNSGSRIITASKVDIDVCDRLWTVDVGEADVIRAGSPLRPPRLLVYDLKTDKLVDEYVFSGEVPSNVVVDVTKDKCDRAFAYGAYSYGIVVYDFANKDSWTWEQRNLLFDRMTTALSGLNGDGYRTLYFQSPNITQQFSVSTRVLQNKTAVDNDIEGSVANWQRGDKGSCFAFDEKTGVFLFKKPIEQVARCWNSIKHADSVNTTGVISIIDNVDKNVLAATTGFKVDKNGNLRVVIQRVPENQDGRVEFKKEVEIAMAPVADLIKGTVCDPA